MARTRYAAADVRPTFTLHGYYRNRAGHKVVVVEILEHQIAIYDYEIHDLKRLDRWGNHGKKPKWDIVSPWPSAEQTVIIDEFENEIPA